MLRQVIIDDKTVSMHLQKTVDLYAQGFNSGLKGLALR